MRRVWLSLFLLVGCSGSRALVDGGESEVDPALASDAGTDASELDEVDGAVLTVPGVDAGPDGGLGPLTSAELFDTWQAMEDGLLEAHPWHFVPVGKPGEKLEASPEELYRFVRDEIRNYPGGEGSFGDAANAGRWGVRGTLRALAGTPREKAELLAALYGMAGLDARVLVGVPDPAFVDPHAMLMHRPSTQASTGLPEAELAALLERAGVEVDELTPQRAYGEERARALSARLEQALGGAGESSFDWQSLTALPLVRVRVAGVDTFANPSVPTGEFGHSYVLGEPVLTDQPMTELDVSISVRAIPVDGDPLTLVEGAWPASELVGRRVLAGFTPEGPYAQHLTLPLAAMRTYTPALLVQGADLDAQAAAKLSFVGTRMSSRGDAVVVDAEGNVSVEGEPLTQADDGDALRVKTLEVTADAERFPEVVLRVSAFDDEGQLVEGLTAQNFAVRDREQLVSALMTRNVAHPKVLLVMDNSGSIPAEFRGEGAVAFGGELAAGLFAQAKRTSVRVASIDEGRRGLLFHGDWSSDLDEVKTQLGQLTGQSSDVWTAAASARTSGADVMLFVTDGRAGDRLTDAVRDAITQGPPIVAVGVGNVNMTTLEQIAELAKGLAFSAEKRADAVSAVEAYLAQRALVPYELTYDAPSLAAGEHALALSLVARDLAAHTSYVVPEAPVLRDRFKGVVLTVRVGDREVTRTLAGEGPGEHSGLTLDQLYAQVQDAYGDSVVLSFEGAPPALIQHRRDRLHSLASLRPLSEALATGDPERILAAVANGHELNLRELAALQAPLGDIEEDALTYETGLYVALFHGGERSTGHAFAELDILPISHVRTAALDPALAFSRNLLATAQRAIAESDQFPVSAVSLLRDLPLTAVRSHELEAALASLAEPLRQRWQHATAHYRGLPDTTLLVPRDFATVAFFAVDAHGHAIGVLESQAGGSSWELVLEKLEKIFNAIGKYTEYRPLPSLLSLWVSVQKIVLTNLARSAILYDIYVTAGPVDAPEEHADPVRDLGCDVADFATDSALGQIDIWAQLMEASAKFEAITGKELLTSGFPPCHTEGSGDP